MVPHRNVFNQRLSLKPMADLKWEWKVVFLINKYSKYSTCGSKVQIASNLFPKQVFDLHGCIVAMRDHKDDTLKSGDSTKPSSSFTRTPKTPAIT